MNSTVKLSCQDDDLGLAMIYDFDVENSNASRSLLCTADMQVRPLTVDHLLVLGQIS